MIYIFLKLVNISDLIFFNIIPYDDDDLRQLRPTLVYWTLKKKNWFTLKSCSCTQKACQEAFQAHYSFGKLGGYKCLYCNKYDETQI